MVKPSNRMIMKMTYILLTAAFLAAACGKETHDPVNPKGGSPATISNVQVENLNGSAKITYSLPDDNDVLYVKATYEMRPGKTREVKSSYYNNFLLVDGFGDTLKHQIKLTVVTRSSVESAPVNVEVEPKLPPVLMIRRTFKVREDFGGVNLTFTNDTRAEIAIVAMTKDSTGKMKEFNTFYTKSVGTNYSLRGFEDTKREFRFFVRDQYGNYSDTLTGDWVPMYEKQLDRSKFREVILPGDIPDGWQFYPIPNLWAGTMWHSADKLDGMPMWITFDLGVVAQLSRIGLWQRPNEWLYMQNNVRQIEIWGMATTPPADGSWNGWTRLLEHTLIKPSGLPVGQLSQEDRDKGAAGEQMNVPLTMPKVRYIRVKILRTWTDGGYAANIQEMRFWGNDK